MIDTRIANEIVHGKYLSLHGAGEIWNWESPAGQVRWQRRVKILTHAIKDSYKVLELGCGTGYFTKEIVSSGASITAIDISPDLLITAKTIVNSPNVQFIEENAYAMKFPNETFDVVVGSSVLHHLDITKAISEMYRVLKKGGFICFTEPNMVNPQIALQKNIPWLKRKLGDSPDETAFFRWSLQRKLKKAGFNQIKVRPFDFLHPAIPPALIRPVSSIGLFVEKLPLMREIAGSLIIEAIK